MHSDVDQVYDYCTTFAPRRTEASEKIVRQRVAAAIRHPYYWGLVMNLSPETQDELVHLVPELDVRSKATNSSGTYYRVHGYAANSTSLECWHPASISELITC